MDQKGMKPNEFTYRIIIEEVLCLRAVTPNSINVRSKENAKESIGKWDEAKRLLADTVNKGISPDAYMVNALISALCKDGKIQEAISVFDLMTQRGIRPDVITYTTPIHAFCKAYKMLINGYAKSKSKEILRLADEMLQTGFTLNMETHKMLRGLRRL
ncbi:hypothetical protein GOBAR_DD19984 [Gossypium barbadense]|nr:hypothetical protein GOBAR_DD19984 [Gossypium barbadense]